MEVDALRAFMEAVDQGDPPLPEICAQQQQHQHFVTQNYT